MNSENFESFKIKELQDFCRSNKLPIYGKKSILIERIKEFKSKSFSPSIESLSQESSSSNLSHLPNTASFPIACNIEDINRCGTNN